MCKRETITPSLTLLREAVKAAKRQHEAKPDRQNRDLWLKLKSQLVYAERGE